MQKTSDSRPASADATRFHFGALTPTMADHLRHRAAVNAERRAIEVERMRSLFEDRNKHDAAHWLPIQDWQD